jgi:hypothetical protein
MVISCADGRDRPVACVCGKGRFHRHGSYWRRIAEVLVMRFICVGCGVTVSMVPSHCVAYEDYPAATINPVLTSMLGRLRARRGGCMHAVVDLNTGYRWRREFIAHAGKLPTDGARWPPPGTFNPPESRQFQIAAGTITAMALPNA